MKKPTILSAILFLTSWTSLSMGAVQVINVDFNGKRPGDAEDGGTYAGVSAAGSGTVFNGVTADSTGGDDNLNIAASGLLDESGIITLVGFTFSTVGGDHETSQSFSPAALYDDYIFNNSAGNSMPGGSPFTINGLGSVAAADLYFYLSVFNAGTIALADFAGNGDAGTYNGLGATAFLNVPVNGGSISGIFGSNGATSVLGGFSVVTVPEPALAGLLGMATIPLMLRRRRGRKAV